MSETAVGTSAALLRSAFDRSFVEPLSVRDVAVESLLAVRMGGEAYAIRTSDTGGLYAGRRIAPLPSSMSELLGLASFRGQVVPVYDLPALMGYAKSVSPRWMVLARQTEPLAFAFDAFESQLVVEAASIDRQMQAMHHRPYIGGVLQADVVRPVVELAAVCEHVAKRVNVLRSQVPSVL